VEAESVYDEIQALLDEPLNADLPRIERTLTDGYATALSLEAERWRIEKRMGEITSTFARGGTKTKTEELSALARRLEASDDALTRLRTLLASLRARADAARALV
jgi:hypothetical protein